MSSIAVGHQHNHESTPQALKNIYKQFGIPGLWRGASGAVVRIAVGSSVQLSSFSICKEYFKKHEVIIFNYCYLLSNLFRILIMNYFGCLQSLTEHK